MRPIWIILALASAQLAGCLGEDGSVDTAAKGPERLSNGAQIVDEVEQGLAQLSEAIANDPVNASAPVPLWRVGDAWGVSSSGAGANEEHTVVVTGVSGTSYALATTSESTAGYDAVYDISWLGGIRTSDLAGSQQGGPVKFFDFPLTDGKTWTTTWDGLEVTLTAKANPAISTPMGTKPGFDITGMAGDEVHASYDYVPALRWWSRLAFPTQGYEIRVTSTTANWTGTVVSATANEVLSIHPSGPSTYVPANPFTVSDGQSWLLLTLISVTQQQARAISILDPAGQPVPMGEGQQDFMFDPQPHEEFTTAQLPGTPGQWELMIGALHDPDGFLLLTIHELAIAPVDVA